MNQPHRPVGPGDHVFLVDGSSFVFRAYYQSIRQDQKYNYRMDRLPIGAVRLFATKILQFVKDGAAGVRPTHLAIIFDKSEDSFRKKLYPAYKSNRSEPPAELVPQFPLMRATVRAFGMIPVEQDVYEADDLIATYARQARERDADVLIVSADKDLMQLVEPKVVMYDPASGERDERRFGPAEVVDYFGVGPDKVVDVQALAGDSTDCVPGAPGIGVKTAAQLINEYGDLETLLARAGEHQAAEAARGADAARERRAHPRLEGARDAGARRRHRDAARRSGAAEARRARADRLLQGDGADGDHASRRGNVRRRRRLDRPRSPLRRPRRLAGT